MVPLEAATLAAMDPELSCDAGAVGRRASGVDQMSDILFGPRYLIATSPLTTILATYPCSFFSALDGDREFVKYDTEN